MLGKRLPLLSAFLGGCLCTAVLVGVRDADRKPRAPIASTQHASLFVSALEAAESDADIQAEPPPTQAEDADVPGQEVGSSLADVLSRLERAYKALSPEPATEETSAVPVAAAAAAAAAPASVPEAAAVVPAPVAAVTAAPPATADAALAVPQAYSESTAVEPPSAGLAGAPPVESRPVTYVAELHQDIHVGDVHHGDRYQVEQLAVLQYLQLLALSSYANGLSIPPARAVSPRRATAPTRALRGPRPITVIPNPDNPWGFKFPPPALVK